MTTLNLTPRPGYDKRTKALVSDMLDGYRNECKWNGTLESIIAEYISERPVPDTDEMIANLISLINGHVREAIEEFENSEPGPWGHTPWGAAQLVAHSRQQHGEYTANTMIDEYVSDLLADALYLVEETLKRL